MVIGDKWEVSGNNKLNQILSKSKKLKNYWNLVGSQESKNYPN